MGIRAIAGQYWTWAKANQPIAINQGMLVIMTLTFVATTFTSCKQIRLSRLTQQNSLVYQMQKDEREIGLAYAANKAEPITIFATVQSIFIQKQLDSITDDVWFVFEQDFCRLMSDEHLRRAWQEAPKAPFSPEFQAYMVRLITPNSPPCGRAT